MAELIPFNYRLRVIQRQQLSFWTSVAISVGVLSLFGVGAIFAWCHKCASENEQLQAEYKEKSTLIDRSEDLRARRQDLANRMQKIQQLMDDRTLLSLLRNISGGFSGRDCLQYINIDAHAVSDTVHPVPQPAADHGVQTVADRATQVNPEHYVVHIVGITENSTTLADLMTRLGKNADPPVNVVLQSSKREPLLDGQVMHFEILCEQPETKGS